MSVAKKASKPNIVLITCDTVRADHLGVMGYGKDTTPFIDSLARQGVLFTSAFSASTDTTQSFPTIMSSTYPLDYGGYARMERPRVMVSEVLQKAGYHTMGFHSIAYLSEYFGYNKGWNEFRFLDHFGEKNSSSLDLEETLLGKISERVYSVHQWLRKNALFLEIPLNFLKRFLFFCYFFIHDVIKPPPFYFYTAEETNREVKESIPGKPDKPLFLWVHYMDAHTPYGMFLKERGIGGRIRYFFVKHLLDFLNEYPVINRFFSNLYMSLYDQSIRYVDDAIRDLFGHLRKIGVLGYDDFAIITSDHGEEFFEHGGVLHSAKLWNTHINVPLIVTGPEKSIGEPRKFDIPRGAIDIAPTILDFAGVKKPASYSGQNLFNEVEMSVFSETSHHSGMLANIRLAARCVIDSGYKLIDSNGNRILFSLSDKKEEHDLYGKNPEIAKKLGKKLDSFKSCPKNI